MIGRETRERILQTCKVHGSDSNINIAAFHLLCDGLVELGRAEGRSEARKTMVQLFTDPENQPSQYGTVTLEYMERELEARMLRLRKIIQAREDECETHSAAVYEATRLLAEAREQRDELLEALKVVLDDLEYKHHARVINVSNAAIAKAEGKT